MYSKYHQTGQPTDSEAFRIHAFIYRPDKFWLMIFRTFSPAFKITPMQNEATNAIKLNHFCKLFSFFHTTGEAMCVIGFRVGENQVPNQTN